MLNLSRGAAFLFFFFLAFSGQAANLSVGDENEFLIFTFASSGSSVIEKIDINIAPLEDLVKIIHIGEVRARELISLRPFSSLDDLTRIKGIGKTNIEDIKKQGLAWVSEQPRAEPNESIVEEQPQQDYPTGIIINEILPSPEGADAEKEWIEILNQNSFAVDLTGWQISDTIGATKSYTFPKESLLGANEFLLLLRPTTKITLNNSGDGLKLIQPDGRIADSVNYEKAPRNESFNRFDSRWFWSLNLTPGTNNIIEEETGKAEEEIQKEDENKEEGLAAISKAAGEVTGETNFFPLLIATTLAISSGIIILNLKKKIKTN